MAARGSRSRRRSAAPVQLENVVFFVDRSLGRYIVAEALREAKALVEIHDDHFPPDEPDTVWIREVGHRRWVVLTRDERILRRRSEKQAVIDAKLRVFIPSKRKGAGKDWANMFVKALPAMLRFMNKRLGPFVARVNTVRSRGALTTRVTMFRSFEEE